MRSPQETWCCWLKPGCSAARRDFLEEALRQLETCMTQNPVPRDINYASALEVAFRALSADVALAHGRR